jgi:cysteine desulfurase NifS
MVRISTSRGAITVRAEVTDDIAPGFIEVNHACGSPVGPEEWSERNVNELTDLANHDPISGFPVCKCLLCQVEKVEDGKIGSVGESCEITEDELGVSTDINEDEEIYLDNNATTPLSKEVQETIETFLSEYGNPSSIHRAGKRMKTLVDDARRKVAGALNCTSKRLVFTGSGSEANNLAIKGIAFKHWKDNPHFITTEIEHPATLKAFEWLEEHGFDVTRLPPNSNGQIDPADFRKALNNRTVLASIMLANNETGVILPIEKLAEEARRNGVLFHCDAIQGLGKIPVDTKQLGVDLLSISSHKIYGPKGIGALYLRKGVVLEPLISGGEQEEGLRAGTENTLGIIAFGKAVESVDHYLKRMESIRKLGDSLEAGILNMINGSFVNGHGEEQLPNTISITLPGFRGESIVTLLSQHGIFISSGSACKSGSPKPSATLLAMGLTEEQAHCTIRISLGIHTTEADVKRTLDTLERITTKSRKAVNFAPCR